MASFTGLCASGRTSTGTKENLVPRRGEALPSSATTTNKSKGKEKKKFFVFVSFLFFCCVGSAANGPDGERKLFFLSFFLAVFSARVCVVCVYPLEEEEEEGWHVNGVRRTRAKPGCPRGKKTGGGQREKGLLVATSDTSFSPTGRRSWSARGCFSSR